MIEEFFDLCKLYPIARRIRVFTKAFSFAYEWNEEYKAEEPKGIVLLQREKRLSERRTEILSASIQQQEAKQRLNLEDDNGKELLDELYDVDEKLNEVRGLYRVHQEEMRRIFLNKTNNSYSRDVEMARKPQYSLIPGHDKPYIWRKQRKGCALSGGCCGRECGCCEKPLKVVLSTPGILSKRKEIGLYGHCTAECGCCIKHIGAYEPHPMFTKKSVQKTKIEKRESDA